jgi:hypothetical protein
VVNPPRTTPAEPGRDPAAETSAGAGSLSGRLLVRLVLPRIIGVVLLALAAADLVRVPAAVLMFFVPGATVGHVFGRLTRVA